MYFLLETFSTAVFGIPQGPSWGAIVGIALGIATLASGVPTTLLAWLHIRMNTISREQKAEIRRLDERIEAEKTAMMHTINVKFISKDTIQAKFDAIIAGQEGIHKRVGDLLRASTKTQEATNAQGERIAASEATSKAQGDRIASIEARQE